MAEPDDPRSELAVADQARQRLADGTAAAFRLAPGTGRCHRGPVGTAAYGVAAQTAAGLAVALAGVAVFLGVAGPALYEFRRINGVRVDGLASVSERGVVRRIALTSTRKDALREHVAAPRQLIDLVD